MSKKRSEQTAPATPGSAEEPKRQLREPLPAHIAEDTGATYAPETVSPLKLTSGHPGVEYAIPEGNTTGRPEVVINEAMLYEAAKTFASYEHLAKIFGVGKTTLQMGYKDLIERARAETCKDLLAAQFYNAIRLNNPVMQIWLGKNYLGQQDKVIQEQTGADGKPIQHEHTHRAVAYIPENSRDLPQITAKIAAPADPPVVLDEEDEEVDAEVVEESPKRVAVASIPDNGRDTTPRRKLRLT